MCALNIMPQSKNHSQKHAHADEKRVIDCTKADIFRLVDFFDGADINPSLLYVFSLSNASPLGRALMNRALRRNWGVALDDTIDLPELDMEDRVLFLPADSIGPQDDGLDLFIHFMTGLRFIERAQKSRYNLQEESYLDEIDGVIHAMMVAYELQRFGQPGLWRAFIASRYGDMAVDFAGVYDAYEVLAPEKATVQACASAFRRFFASKDRIEKLSCLLLPQQSEHELEQRFALIDNEHYLAPLSYALLHNPAYQVSQYRSGAIQFSDETLARLFSN